MFFGTAAFVQAPFTEDLDVVRVLLNEAQPRMVGPSTAMGDAMGLSITMFERSELEDRVLILLTDGNDTGSLVPPLKAAQIAADEGVVVHTVAVGDPTNAGETALDEDTLRSVANTTGGQYFFAGDRDSLGTIYAELDKLNPKQVETASYRPQRDLYHWPLGLATIWTLVLLAGIALRRGLKLSKNPVLSSQPETKLQEVT